LSALRYILPTAAHPLPALPSIINVREMSTCTICGWAGEGPIHQVREMMFGYRDPFQYRQCTECGCLQLLDAPIDLGRYYPASYHSFHSSFLERRGIRRRMRAIRDRSLVFGGGLIGGGLQLCFPHPYPNLRRWLRNGSIGLDARILDVGCGSGELLWGLSGIGFRHLLGIDPFLEKDMVIDDRVQLLRRQIEGVDGTFDVIMLHHSLEHIADQHGTFRSVARLLAPGGYVLVRIPVLGFAWEHYGTDWYQLDAPRHFVLHSTDSIRRLGEAHGLALDAVEYDSTEHQFMASELYRRDIPLVESDGQFTPAEIAEFRTRADALNRQRRGDSAAFYFVHGSP
jgi:SAM-dependent methyltransferase